MTNMRYNYVSADPGAGKTDWAINMAKRWNMAGQPVMLIVPTIKLCDEIQARSGGLIEAIHSNKTGASVREIEERMTEWAKTYTAGSIVITDAAFIQMRYRTAAGNWIVIKDEPKEPLNIAELRVPDSMPYIEDTFMTFEQTIESRQLLNGTLLKPKYKYSDIDDDITGQLARIKHFLTHPEHFEVLFEVDMEAKRMLRYSIFTKPELFEEFAEVYLMGANFSDTFIYHMWEKQGVEWQNKTPKSLRRLPSDRMVIRYLWDYDNHGNMLRWSKAFRDRTDNGTKLSNLDSYLEWLRVELPDGDYVYVANNDYDDDHLNLNGVRMPAEVHGLNKYRHYTKVAVAGSYLVNRHHEIFYHHYGMSTTDVRGMRNTQYYVQQITRTDIRNYNGTAQIEVYVPTLTEALELLVYFRDATIVDAEAKRAGVLNQEWESITYTETPAPNDNTIVFGLNTYQKHIDVVNLDEEEELDDRPKTSTERSRMRRSRVGK